jgi:hypothetical protein
MESVVTLQYRIARDAYASSKLVAIVGGGMTSALSLDWQLPTPKSEEERMAQHRDKERFHHLIEILEAKQINGVELECNGSLRGFVLQATGVPRLTKRGHAQIESHR